MRIVRQIWILLQSCFTPALKNLAKIFDIMGVILLIIIAVVNVVGGEYVKIWEDEFNGGNLTDRWNFELGCSGYGNNEMQCYTDNRYENVRQENGRLVITARREWWGDGENPDKEFTSVRMTSKLNWLYGRFEIRARMPKGKHLWPAIWMFPAYREYGEWPRSGEMDIAEYRGQRPQQMMGNLHFGSGWEDGRHGAIGTGDRNFPMDFSKEFYTYGFDWTPTLVQWMIDDQTYHWESLEKNFWVDAYSTPGSPFDKNFFIILNLAVGGNFFGGEPFHPDESSSWEKPTFEIEWVRVYEWHH